jgi:hypothetical protein
LQVLVRFLQALVFRIPGKGHTDLWKLDQCYCRHSYEGQPAELLLPSSDLQPAMLASISQIAALPATAHLGRSEANSSEGPWIVTLVSVPPLCEKAVVKPVVVYPMAWCLDDP